MLHTVTPHRQPTLEDLTIFSPGRDRNCQTVSRREFLRIGTLGGLTLPGLLAAKSRGAEISSAVKDKSIVVLFLAGGAPQIETFDPKMSAPAEVRSVVGEVQTSIPGVTFGGAFPKLAKLASKMAIVRAFRHGNTDHNVAPGMIISGNNMGGRDHWGNLCTLALAGGGLKMGQVIGASDAKASAPASEPIGVENLAATMMHTLFDPAILRLQPKAAVINTLLAQAEPIRQLI